MLLDAFVPTSIPCLSSANHTTPKVTHKAHNSFVLSEGARIFGISAHTAPGALFHPPTHRVLKNISSGLDPCCFEMRMLTLNPSKCWTVASILWHTVSSCGPLLGLPYLYCQFVTAGGGKTDSNSLAKIAWAIV